jgi:hypothetical protein
VRQLELSDAPPSGFTVQTLLLMTIAVYGEGNLDQSRAILDRAIFQALEIQMNSRVSPTWRETRCWGRAGDERIGFCIFPIHALLQEKGHLILGESNMKKRWMGCRQCSV